MASTLRPGIARRSSRSARSWALGALILVVLSLAAALRVATEATPPLRLNRTLATYVRVRGAPPTLAWPREGQAAVEVEEVGSFGASGSPTPVPIASVAKVMTAYLTLVAHPLARGQQGFVMRVTPTDAAEQGLRVALGESTVAVRPGERITERQALEGLLLPSANNIAALIAAHEIGGTKAFLARMNATAHALHMSSTTYTDPSGFNQSTVSTAADQLKLARIAMSIPTFAAIVAQRTAVLPVVGRVSNYNGLVGEDGYVGVKTGSDGSGGGCLVFAKRVTIGARGLLVLGVVLGQRQGALIEAALASARLLGDSAAAALRSVTVLPAGANVLHASGTGGQRSVAVAAQAVREIGWPGLTLPVAVRPRTGLRTLRAGEQVATVWIHGSRAPTTDAIATRALGGPSVGWRLRHLF